MPSNAGRVAVVARAASIMLVVLSGSAWSQTPTIPVGPLQSPPVPVTRPLPPPEPGVIPGPARPGATGIPAGAELVQVTPVAIALEGGTVYGPTQFDGLIRPLIGRSIAASEIFKLAEAIQRKYHDDGYFLAQVTVPPQRVGDGRVRLRIVEGAIADVKVEGDAGAVSSLVRGVLGRIKSAGVPNIRDIERYLLLVEEIAGVKMKAVLRAGKEPGTTDLIAQVKRQSWDVFHQADNRGSDFIGPQQSLLVVGVNSFTSMGERLEATWFSTLGRQNNFFQTTASAFVGTDGLRVRAYGGFGHVEPGGAIAATGYAGDLAVFGVGANYPLMRSRRTNVNVGGSFDYYNSIVDINGTRQNTTNLRMLRAQVDASHRDEINGVTYGFVKLSRGLGLLGASDPGDITMARVGSDPTFFKAQGEVSRLQGVYIDADFTINLLGSFAWQYSDDILPASEKYFVGGDRLGRGYFAGQITGDKAIGGSFELQVSTVVPYDGADGGFVDGNRRARGLPVQLYAFFDFAKGWNNLSSDTPSTIARSAGGGVRTSMLDHVTLEAEAVRRLDLDVDGASAPQLAPWAFYFRATTRF